jgi:hypothetical protein
MPLKQWGADSGHNEERRGPHVPFTAAIQALLLEQKAEHERLKKAGRIVPWSSTATGKAIKACSHRMEERVQGGGHPGPAACDDRSAVRNRERQGVSRFAEMAMAGPQDRVDLPNGTRSWMRER